MRRKFGKIKSVEQMISPDPKQQTSLLFSNKKLDLLNEDLDCSNALLNECLLIQKSQISGRRDMIATGRNVVINKAAADVMGLKDPVGAKVGIWGSEWTVIGVTEDFIMGSPYAPVDPTVMVFMPDWSSTINVRLEKTL